MAAPAPRHSGPACVWLGSAPGVGSVRALEPAAGCWPVCPQTCRWDSLCLFPSSGRVIVRRGWFVLCAFPGGTGSAWGTRRQSGDGRTGGRVRSLFSAAMLPAAHAGLQWCPVLVCGWQEHAAAGASPLSPALPGQAQSRRPVQTGQMCTVPPVPHTGVTAVLYCCTFTKPFLLWQNVHSKSLPFPSVPAVQ